MKFSSLTLVAALAVPVAAEIYFKEQFNDKVSEKNESSGAVVAQSCGRPRVGRTKGRKKPNQWCTLELFIVA